MAEEDRRLPSRRRASAPALAQLLLLKDFIAGMNSTHR